VREAGPVRVCASARVAEPIAHAPTAVARKRRRLEPQFADESFKDRGFMNLLDRCALRSAQAADRRGHGANRYAPVSVSGVSDRPRPSQARPKTMRSSLTHPLPRTIIISTP
jgi:hypothetical protein